MEPTKEELKIINKVAKILSPIFAFSYYDKEDIEQEVKLLCLQLLNDFDKSKSSLYTFLFTHSRNHLIDLKRVKYKYTLNPCAGCKDYGVCQKLYNKLTCEKCVKYIKNNEQKYDLAHVYPISDTLFYEVDLVEDLNNKYIFEDIDSAIPANIRHSYKKFLDGISLSYYDKKIVMDTIKQIAIEKGYISGEV